MKILFRYGKMICFDKKKKKKKKKIVESFILFPMIFSYTHTHAFANNLSSVTRTCLIVLCL